MKSLKPKKLIFTSVLGDAKSMSDMSRVNFQKKLLTYTEEGKSINYQPIVSTNYLSEVCRCHKRES